MPLRSITFAPRRTAADTAGAPFHSAASEKQRIAPHDSATKRSHVRRDLGLREKAAVPTLRTTRQYRLGRRGDEHKSSPEVNFRTDGHQQLIIEIWRTDRGARFGDRDKPACPRPISRHHQHQSMRELLNIVRHLHCEPSAIAQEGDEPHHEFMMVWRNAVPHWRR